MVFVNDYFRYFKTYTIRIVLFIISIKILLFKFILEVTIVHLKV